MKDEMNMKTIREMMDSHGVTARTLRYWEKEELLSPLRQHGGNSARLYDATQERRVRLILKAKVLGLSIDDIYSGLEDDKLTVPVAWLHDLQAEAKEQKAAMEARYNAIHAAIWSDRDMGSDIVVLTAP